MIGRALEGLLQSRRKELNSIKFCDSLTAYWFLFSLVALATVISAMRWFHVYKLYFGVDENFAVSYITASFSYLEHLGLPEEPTM